MPTESKQNSSKYVSSNHSTEKVLSILELLSYSEGPMRLVDIASQLEANSSTVLRFLNSLEKSGYVCKDLKNGTYRMTFKICSLANSITSRTNLVQIAIPYVARISRETLECVCLSTMHNDSVVFMYVSDPPTQMLHTIHQVGSTAPLYCTGAGKAFLADMSSQEVDDYILRNTLHRFNSNTLTTREALRAELEATRSRGYALDNEECEDGVRCIALPIRNYTGRVIASISITGPSRRLNARFISENIDFLKEVASELSIQLGYVFE